MMVIQIYITKGFNIDINRLNNHFKNIKKLDLNKNGIDRSLISLFELSLQVTIFKVKEKSPNNSKMIDNLQNNLSLFNIETIHRESRQSIIEKTETLIKNKSSFKNLTVSQIEDKLKNIIFDSDTSTKNNKNKI